MQNGRNALLHVTLRLMAEYALLLCIKCANRSLRANCLNADGLKKWWQKNDFDTYASMGWNNFLWNLLPCGLCHD
jgi:hypothetical protein